MAIYRGPGGAGDATGDATNASALALAARDEAIAAAAAAASSETAAGNSATDADASADASAVSASNAATSAGAASTFATNASNSATAASSSAATATTKASQASTSATAAASSASAASTSASNASTSATNAASSASTASTQAANASNSASSAATSATNAASSATAASSSASDAAASAALINDSLLVHKATDETITGTKTFTANQIISVTDNTNAALRITQLGTGDALLVEDSANPDSSPFVINAAGSVGIGTSSPSYNFDIVKSAVSAGVSARVRNSDATSATSYAQLRLETGLNDASINAYSGTAGAGYLSFFNEGSERMRIDSSGLVTMYENVGIGAAASNSYGLYLGSEITSGVNQYGVGAISTLAGTSWSAAVLTGMPLKASTAYTSIAGVRAINPTTATGATASYLYGVKVEDQTLGTNNYGIASDVSSGTNKWNIYASGTAQNYFAGNVGIGKTPTYKVDVAGDVNITGDFYKNGTIFSGGAKGGGSDAVFYENNQTVTTNYTITSGNNAMSAGPITVSSGVTVTVPSGSVWTIV